MRNDSIGSRMKQLRKARKLSQRALAKQAGVSQGLISLVENGERSGEGMAVGAAKNIAFVLGVALDALVGLSRLAERDVAKDAPHAS